MKCDRLIVIKNDKIESAYSEKTRGAQICNGVLKSIVNLGSDCDASGAITSCWLYIDIKCQRCKQYKHGLDNVLEQIIDKYIEGL